MKNFLRKTEGTERENSLKRRGVKYKKVLPSDREKKTHQKSTALQNDVFFAQTSTIFSIKCYGLHKYDRGIRFQSEHEEFRLHLAEFFSPSFDSHEILMHAQKSKFKEKGVL